MSNNGKSLTNVSFRAKMLEVIDKLKDQDKTALVRHVDDFEALNKDTFEAGMNALVEAIPEGGGGGGGTGDGGYVVTFGMDFQNEGITCDKTIEDIIAHANKHIVGRFVIKGLPMDGAPVTADIYCDNLKFDYQQLNSDDPSVAPIIPTYTYLGFSGDAFILILLDGAPRENSPLEDNEIQYYKTCVSIYYLFADENPHWELNISDLNGGKTEIETWNMKLPDDPFNSPNPISELKLVVKNTSYSEYAGNAMWQYSGMGEFNMGEIVSWFSKYVGEYKVTRLNGATSISFANGAQAIGYKGAAQFPITIDLSSYLSPSRNDIQTVFTISKYSAAILDGAFYNGGYLELFSDIDDLANNRIIRHIIIITRYSNNWVTHYKQVEIPYTLHSY